MEPSQLGSDLEKVLVDEAELEAKVRELASQVDTDYAGQDRARYPWLGK